MKFTIEGFSQKKLIELGLDIQDAIILNYLKLTSINNKHVFIDYEEILSELPILKISTVDALQRKIRYYETCGIIKAIDKDLVVDCLKNKRLSNKGFGNKVCSWCLCNTTILHKHHYPVPKMNGGTKTIQICSNCHNEFHYSNFYEHNFIILESV